MYCNCSNKQPITNSIFGETFQVCSKSKGGCGMEILQGSCNILLLSTVPKDRPYYAGRFEGQPELRGNKPQEGIWYYDTKKEGYFIRRGNSWETVNGAHDVY